MYIIMCLQKIIIAISHVPLLRLVQLIQGQTYREGEHLPEGKESVQLSATCIRVF